MMPPYVYSLWIFRTPFDRISHQYLYQVIKSYGISPWFTEHVHSLDENTTASIKINGNKAGPIPIQRSVRQGCPLSMALYVLCLHSLLRILEDKLPGITIGQPTRSFTVVAYAKDVTVFVTQPTDFTTKLNAIQFYEQAKGAHLNQKKSKALAIGRWTAPENGTGD